MASLKIQPSISVSTVTFSRRVRIDRHHSFRFPIVFAPNLSISMCLNESSTRTTTGFEANNAIKHTEDHPEQVVNGPATSCPYVESSDGEVEGVMGAQKQETLQPKRHAKLHDFCLGIPFGGIMFGAGLIGFLFSRNPANLTTGVMFGGAIFAMGVLSLNVWRKGLSSLPLVLGQAVLAATLLWKHLQIYSLTKKIFPTGLYVTLSAAMLCFYTYNLISGGNPPPKKKVAASTSL